MSKRRWRIVNPHWKRRSVRCVARCVVRRVVRAASA
jgi:hypothetical protein